MFPLYRYACPGEPSAPGAGEPTSGKYHFLVVKIPLRGQVATCRQKSKIEGGGAKFSSAGACGRRKIDRFQANPWQNGSRRQENKAKVVFLALNSRKIGSDSGRRRLRNRRLAATLSEPTLAGARGTENESYHTTFLVTVPLSKTKPKKW